MRGDDEEDADGRGEEGAAGPPDDAGGVDSWGAFGGSKNRVGAARQPELLDAAVAIDDGAGDTGGTVADATFDPTPAFVAGTGDFSEALA